MKGLLPTLIWCNRERYDRYKIWLDLWGLVSSWGKQTTVQTNCEFTLKRSRTTLEQHG